MGENCYLRSNNNATSEEERGDRLSSAKRDDDDIIEVVALPSNLWFLWQYSFTLLFYLNLLVTSSHFQPFCFGDVINKYCGTTVAHKKERIKQNVQRWDGS